MVVGQAQRSFKDNLKKQDEKTSGKLVEFKGEVASQILEQFESLRADLFKNPEKDAINSEIADITSEPQCMLFKTCAH